MQTLCFAPWTRTRIQILIFLTYHSDSLGFWTKGLWWVQTFTYCSCFYIYTESIQADHAKALRAWLSWMASSEKMDALVQCSDVGNRDMFNRTLVADESLNIVSLSNSVAQFLSSELRTCWLSEWLQWHLRSKPVIINHIHWFKS